MSLVKLTLATTLAAALTLAMSSTALADTVKQEQELNTKSEVKVTCTTGAYGQSSTCTAEADAEANGKQSQEIVYRTNGRAIVAHKPVDTGADVATTAAVSGTVLAGAAAAVVQIKSRLQ